MHGEHGEADADARAVALAITLGVQHDELDLQRLHHGLDRRLILGSPGTRCGTLAARRREE